MFANCASSTRKSTWIVALIIAWENMLRFSVNGRLLFSTTFDKLVEWTRLYHNKTQFNPIRFRRGATVWMELDGNATKILKSIPASFPLKFPLRSSALPQSLFNCWWSVSRVTNTAMTIYIVEWVVKCRCTMTVNLKLCEWIAVALEST